MKEITLQELLNMADAAAHDGIGDLWNQKTIHYLVVFTSENEDFELIGAGPTLPFTTLEMAAAHTIPGKKPEFYVKCPGALAVRLQPKLAPTLKGMHSPQMRPMPTPSLKGRTSVPFGRTAPRPPPTQTPAVEAPEPAPATELPPDLALRERAIKQREQELSTLADSLRAREALLRDREAAIAAIEERLLNPMR
jgi:hypothetical protein